MNEIDRTVLDARQLVLWRLVEQLNTKPLDVDAVRGLAASYNLMSQQPADRRSE